MKERKIKVNLLPGKHNLPPFLQKNQDITIALKEFGREHLHELSVELFLVHIHNVILPKLHRRPKNPFLLLQFGVYTIPDHF
jgi:hypothetical protein